MFPKCKDIPRFQNLSKNTLRRWIVKLEFCYKLSYLNEVLDPRSQRYRIFYQCETWCNANHTIEYIWHLEENTNNFLKKTNWSVGLMFSKASHNKRNLAKKCVLTYEEHFACKNNTSNYHQEMNRVHFDRWWKEDLLPYLQGKSAILIDNASNSLDWQKNFAHTD